MFRTESQQNASRANGAKSNGPTTPEGKAKSAQNGTTHGLFSTTILLKPESQSAWHKLADGLVKRFKPADDVELNLIYEMAVATWRSQRATAMEAALVNMDYDVLDITDEKANSPEDEVRRCALAYAKAVGRHEAVLEFGKQSERLNRLWIRLHSKLKELQNDRKAEEREAAAAAAGLATAAAEPAKPKSKTEPGVVEITSFQRNAAEPNRANVEPNRAATARERDPKPQEPDEPCTGK